MLRGRTAIVLLSGGMDSAVTLAIARADGFECVALSFRYGQRHAVELESARRVAAALGAAEHRIVDIDLRSFGGSALTDDIAVPKDRLAAATVAAADEIPITYVPARNTIFLSFALALAEVRSAERIYLGVNVIDYSGYPDCRPEFIAAFERLAGLATRVGVTGHPVQICAPLISASKEEIIRRGLELGVDFGMTMSCYDPSPRGAACGHCDACTLRQAAFGRLGMSDPSGERRQ